MPGIIGQVRGKFLGSGALQICPHINYLGNENLILLLLEWYLNINVLITKLSRASLMSYDDTGTIILPLSHSCPTRTPRGIFVLAFSRSSIIK
jgi:hypothetical protein